MSRDIEEIIGSTWFKYGGDRVDITVHRPTMKFDDGDECYCEISIVGVSISYRAKVVGFDSLHALVLAIKSIGYYVHNLERSGLNNVEWPGGDFNLPIL
jgi:hypothetical protein